MDSDQTPSLALTEFVLPGQNPDMRIRIFETREIHVHSFILKIHSEFFRKFLDSPDKSTHDKYHAPWKYDWISEVEDDGGWHLVAVENAISTLTGKDVSKTHRFKGEDVKISLQTDQAIAFINLLNAMYQVPYHPSFWMLYDATELADYYRCLPIVSYHLSACLLLDGSRIAERIGRNPDMYITIAYKLRHAVLFKDCAIHLTGNFDTLDEKRKLNGIQGICDPAIMNVLKDMQLQIMKLLINTQQGVLDIATDDELVMHSLGRPLISHHNAANYKLKIPSYYRGLSSIHSRLTKKIQKLLCNNLVLGNGSQFEAGGEDSPNQFFCGTLSDVDLPWDITQTDW